MFTWKHFVSFLAGMSAMACLSIVLAAIDVAVLEVFVKTTQTHFEGLMLALIIVSMVTLVRVPKGFLSRSAHLFGFGLGAVVHIFLFSFLPGSPWEYGVEAVATIALMNVLYMINCVQHRADVHDYEESYFSSRSTITYIFQWGLLTTILLSVHSFFAPNIDLTIIWCVLAGLVLVVLLDVFVFELYKAWITDAIAMYYLALLTISIVVLVNYVSVRVSSDPRSPVFLVMAMAVVLCAWIFLRDNWYLIKIPKSKEEVATSN